jgi:hypothetical protein
VEKAVRLFFAKWWHGWKEMNREFVDEVDADPQNLFLLVIMNVVLPFAVLVVLPAVVFGLMSAIFHTIFK